MFEFNTLVILSDKKDKQYMITLKEGARFSTQYGYIEHNDIAALNEGDIIKSTLGHPYLVYKPTYMDYVMNIKRQAQIIYPKDAAAMLMWADVAPNQKVLESGIGQGALSIAIRNNNISLVNILKPLSNDKFKSCNVCNDAKMVNDDDIVKLNRVKELMLKGVSNGLEVIHGNNGTIMCVSSDELDSLLGISRKRKKTRRKK